MQSRQQSQLQHQHQGELPQKNLSIISRSVFKRPYRSAGNQIGTSAPIDQVVLLQQLVEKAKSGNALIPLQLASSSNNAPIVSSQNQHVQSIPSPTLYIAAPAQAPLDSKRDEPYANKPGQRYLHREPYDQRSPGDRGNGEVHDRERPPHWRGGFRGGGSGYAGRGGRPRRDYDDRDGGPSKRHRSRSRSPPRFGGRGRGRDIRPYSPPRRPSLAFVQTDNNRDVGSTPPGTLEAGKDEFGRDIRPSSPSPGKNPSRTSQTDIQPNKTSTEDQSNLVQSPIPPKNHAPLQHGLDKVDWIAFDFSSPASWEALGNAWQVTHGVLPSQEQLMQFVMEKMSQGNSVMNSYSENTNYGGRLDSQQQPGKSIPTYESGSNLTNNSWEGQGPSWRKDEIAYDYENGVFAADTATDAVVLGGDDQATSSTSRVQTDVPPSGPSSKGGMRRIGDKWVWQKT